MLIQIITKFVSFFNSTIDGTSNNIEIDELCGGAKIGHIFHEDFLSALDSIDPLDGLTKAKIQTSIRNASVHWRSKLFMFVLVLHDCHSFSGNSTGPFHARSFICIACEASNSWPRRTQFAMR